MGKDKEVIMFKEILGIANKILGFYSPEQKKARIRRRINQLEREDAELKKKSRTLSRMRKRRAIADELGRLHQYLQDS